MFFAADGRRLGLWRSDGTAAGTLVVKEVVNPSGAVVANRTLFFTAGGFIDPAGQELWKSDGTREGTGLVKDIWPGSGASSPYPLVAVGGTLFFSASAPGSEGLWKSNGTEAGTVLVKAISPGGWGTDVNGTLFFDASDGVSGDELWKSDGTAAGTVLVKDIYPGPASSVAQRLVNVDGTVYFMAASHGEPYIAAASDLWKSDGTSEGTVAVKHIGLGWLRNVNGTLFFEGDDGVHGRELWTSDGTSAGTTMVRDINPGPEAASREFRVSGRRSTARSSSVPMTASTATSCGAATALRPGRGSSRTSGRAAQPHTPTS